jgi:hypothetical protein
MGKKKAVLFEVILLSLFLISNISAEIIISQPNALYSLEDELSVQLTLDSLKSGYLDINLNCNSASKNIYHNVPETTTISLKRKLVPTYIGNLSGSCFINAAYNIDEKNSQNFEISNIIDIILDAGNITYNAGESFEIKGNAILRNRMPVNGFVDASVSGFNISSSSSVASGKFSLSLKTSQNLKAGNYALEINAYDKDSEGNILNSGKIESRLELRQLPALFDIAIDKQEINPGETIEIIPFLYDFAGEIFASQVLIKIKNSKEESLFEGYVPANEKFNFAVRENSAPGIGKIIVQKDNIVAEKEIKIKELRKISTTIKNQTLTLKNIGNVAYKAILQIIIGNESILKEINLGLDESKTFELSAPDGNYDIVIKDDSNVYTQGSFSLTGNAISIKEVGQKIDYIFTNYPFVWLFIAIIVLLFLWVLYKKHQTKKKFYFSPADSEMQKNLEKKKGGIEIINPEEKKEKIDKSLFENETRKAEQVTVLHGINQNAGIIAIKLKSRISGISKESLSRALEKAYRNKAVSCQSGEFIILIFSPLITKTNKNEETAIKSALAIDGYLREHNRKFRNNEISYGIGVSCGQIVNRLENNVLKFMALGKTISLARRIAEISNKQVLLSKEVHEKTMNTIKAEKVSSSGGMDLFAIRRIVDTEKASKFVNDFLRKG